MQVNSTVYTVVCVRFTLMTYYYGRWLLAAHTNEVGFTHGRKSCTQCLVLKACPFFSCPLLSLLIQSRLLYIYFIISRIICLIDFTHLLICSVIIDLTKLLCTCIKSFDWSFDVSYFIALRSTNDIKRNISPAFSLKPLQNLKKLQLWYIQ